jgi:hypothetical protein
VTDSGDEIATIHETRLMIDLGERNFSAHCEGIHGPEYQLKSGDTISATASQNQPAEGQRTLLILTFF